MSLWLLLLVVVVLLLLLLVVMVLLLLLLLLVVEEEEAGEGQDGWGVFWVQQLQLEGGLAALALLLLRARASCARLAAKEQATGSSMILKVWRWTTRATLS